MSVFLDNKFAFGISEESLLKYGLKKGQNVSPEEIEKILKNEKYLKLQDAAVHFLGYRPRSEKELKDYLAKKISKSEHVKFSQASQSPVISTVIIKLKKYKLVDDLEFAKWFARARQGSNPKSLKMIGFELRKKGIDKEIIESVLEGSVDEKKLALRAIEKKMKNWQKFPLPELKKKLYRFLLSRGFDYETAKEVFAFFEKKR
jgi:regulatory protein